MPVQSAIAWYMAYLLGMREKQKPPLLEERGEGVCKGLLLQPRWNQNRCILAK